MNGNRSSRAASLLKIPVPQWPRLRVLLVEDSWDIQRVIPVILRPSGISVAIAENGQLGYDMAMQAWGDDRPFDAILMDVEMPVLDGLQATRLLRAAGYERPILAFTSLDGAARDYLSSGCDHWLEKSTPGPILARWIRHYACRDTPGHNVRTLCP